MFVSFIPTFSFSTAACEQGLVGIFSLPLPVERFEDADLCVAADGPRFIRRGPNLLPFLPAFFKLMIERKMFLFADFCFARQIIEFHDSYH